MHELIEYRLTPSIETIRVPSDGGDRKTRIRRIHPQADLSGGDRYLILLLLLMHYRSVPHIIIIIANALPFGTLYYYC